MKIQQITAKLGKGDDAPRVKANYAMPETLDEAIEAWGAETVLYQAKSAVVVALQARMRALKNETVKTEDGTEVPKHTDESLQAEIDKWKPGSGRTVKSKQERALDVAKGMTPEERAALIAALQADLYGEDENGDSDEDSEE